MFRSIKFLKAIVSLTVIAALNAGGLNVYATDLVPSDDLKSGASVFVFRSSRKKPQERGGEAAGSRKGRAGGTVARREQFNKQLAADRKKKADQARARRLAAARAAARERNARLKLSNTLTARADAMMDKGDVAGAAVNYREALKANPKNADAAGSLSDALTVQGIELAGNDGNEAGVAPLEEAIKYDPNNSIAFAKLGEIYDAKNDTAKAILNYEKAVALDPGLTSVFMPLGLAYVDSGNAAKADMYLAKAEAAGIDTSDARFARIEVLSEQNKNTEALAAVDNIIRAEPLNAEAYYQRASIYSRSNDMAKANASYSEAVRIDPQMAAAWFDLGVSYYNQGDYANAVKAYQEVLRIDNTNARAHANLAATYRQLERFREANAEYKLAEANGLKGDADLYSEWGFCLGKTNEWDKSVVRLETAQNISPSAVDDTNVGWAYYNAAQADKAEKRDAEANAKLEKGKQSLQRAVSKDPELDAAYLNLGSTQNSLGEHEEARQSLDNALRLHNDWAIALNQLGLAYRGLNDLSTAISTFNRAVAVDGNNVMGLFNLGSAQYASGDKRGAKRTQDRLRKLRPDLADQLGNIIAGALLDEAGRQIRKKVRIPGLPF